MSKHDAVEVIQAKRDGHGLSDSQIDWVVDAYTRGDVADEQMSALAMAILLRGMDRGEISRWTQAMIASGERMDFSGLSRPTADKHSTGGVGDKITLPLAPLVAACGVAVPQLSGRGLGHTGGTLDKLESIRVELQRPSTAAALVHEIEVSRVLSSRLSALLAHPFGHPHAANKVVSASPGNYSSGESRAKRRKMHRLTAHSPETPASSAPDCDGECNEAAPCYSVGCQKGEMSLEGPFSACAAATCASEC